MSTLRSEDQVEKTSPTLAWPAGHDWPTDPPQAPPKPRRALNGAANPVLPSGTVTLLLADIEGSTRLWEERGDTMAAVLATLDHVLDGLVSVHRGVRPVEQGEGDSFVVAFPRASDAVACALALQQAALSPLRLRIGVHTGDVELRDAGNYMGSTINRAARLRDLAHGGQTVLSAATSHLVIDSLPEQAWLKDLGSHTLRDLLRTERVLQLCHPDLHNDFSPLRSRQAGTFCRRPAQLSSFVGRVNELDYVGRAFADNRLITLCGPGGVGKTRLAVEAAGRAGVQFSDGVWYLDLAAVSDPKRVALAAAQVLGLPDALSRSSAIGLLGHLGERQLLLVVDNCEHLLDATAALVVAVLCSCPNVTVLATSREPLGVSGEQIFKVPPMSVDGDAIVLFIERARKANPAFAPSAGDVAAVAEICRRLDGLPLAIELAASRIRTLSLTEISDGLHNRFRLLNCGSRMAFPRHKTLRACLDWSFALLTDSERAVLSRLAALPGGFDRDAARALSVEESLRGPAVCDVVDALVDKSLLACESDGTRTIYRLSDTTRAYTVERSARGGIGTEAEKLNKE